MKMMMMVIVVSVVCDKLEDSQSHLVQSSVHWHLAAAPDSNGSHQNELLFQMQIKISFHIVKQTVKVLLIKKGQKQFPRK